MKMRVWVVLALSMVFFGACVWSKPDTRTPVAPKPDATKNSFLSAIAEGTTDGINRHVRENLWKRDKNIPQSDDDQHQ